MFNFYIFNNNNISAKYNLPDGYTLKIFIPSIFKLYLHDSKNIMLYLFWYIFSIKGYKIYYVYKDNVIVHYSHILTKNFRFPFMSYNDLEIGPCWTSESHRGKGIYVAVLQMILKDVKNQADKIFIFADDINLASIKGIKRSGFTYFAKGYKKGFFRIYQLCGTYDK